jgi:Ethanolamine utilization protein EutJ (predicted chaperonin)
VVNPCGLSEPLSVAEKLAIKIAELVNTSGGPVGLSVVKVVSLPYVVPQLFIATVRKWYVVLGFNP